MPFPADGLVYDYRLDDAGISQPALEEEEEEELKSRKVPHHKSSHQHRPLYSGSSLCHLPIVHSSSGVAQWCTFEPVSI